VIVPNRRYHIHIICADNDQLLLLDSLAIFFQPFAFLTYDVSSQLPKASLYGRQCIDDCDYALMIIGDSYGSVQRTGVSQMHLSYLSAKAKIKPLLVLIKNHQQDATISRQLQEFIKSVIRQDNQISYYDTEDDIEKLLEATYEHILTNDEVTGGWVRDKEKVLTVTRQEVVERFSDLLSTNKPLKKETFVNDRPVTDGLSPVIVLTDFFDIQYSAQAYEGGNLTDINRPMALTWQEILITLGKISETFSSYGLQNAINRLITSKAEDDVKRDMPNVHAVSRCQISQDDLNKLQRQLVSANWIGLTTYGTRVSQELWKLTSYAKNLLDDSNVEL